jgi:hypothetical protein
VTHDNDKPTPTERPAQDTALSLLAIATPAFRFSFLSAGFHRAKWPALRRKAPDHGARSDVAPDLDEVEEGAQPDPDHVDADG